MPREQINHPDLTAKERQIELRKTVGYNPALPKSDYQIWNESAVHVGWQPAENAPGWVQLGFEADLEYVAFALQHNNGETDDRTFMWSPPLSVAEVDRFITVLKRARRKATHKA